MTVTSATLPLTKPGSVDRSGDWIANMFNKSNTAALDLQAQIAALDIENNGIGDYLEYIFVPTDPGMLTGTVDATAELKTITEAAAADNKWVYILGGTYWVEDFNPDSSVLLRAEKGTVKFRNRLGKACIDLQSYEAWQIAGTTRKTVTALADGNTVDGFASTTDSDYVSVITVADNSGVAPGDIWVISSSDPHPYINVYYITSLTRASTTATAVTSKPHGLTTGDSVTIRGAVETDYNITTTVTVSDTTTFTYTVANSPTSPATTLTDITVTAEGTAKKARFAEAFVVEAVSGSDKIYVQGGLRWRNRTNGTYFYTENMAINKVLTTRKVHIKGIDFTGAATTIGNTTGNSTPQPSAVYGALQDVSTITHSSGVVTVTTAAAHNLVTNDTVRVSGANEAYYNFSGKVTVTGASTFTMVIPATDDNSATPLSPPGSGSATGTLKYQVIFDSTNGTHHSASITIRNCPYARVEDCDFNDTWNMAIRMVASPFFQVLNCNSRGLPNAVSANRNVQGRIGYFCLAYSWCKGGTVDGGVHFQSRHVVTTGGAELQSYSAADWYRQGQPTDLTFKNIKSIACWGVPFDTHEEATHVTFENCEVTDPLRGPQEGSYDGYGMQIRCRDVTVKGYHQVGGTHGIRIAATNVPDSRHLIESASIKQLRHSSNAGTAIIVNDQNNIHHHPQVKVGSIITSSVGRVFEVGREAFVECDQAYAYHVQVRIALLGTASTAAAGGKLRVSHLFTNFQDVSKTGSTTRILIDMNSTSEAYIGMLHLVHGVATTQPTEIFRSADAITGKKIGLGKLVYEDPSNVSGSVVVCETADAAQFSWMFGGDVLPLDVGDETTALTTGVKKTYRFPRPFITIPFPMVSLTTASSAGATTVDINKNGTSIYGTGKIVLGQGVKSLDSTLSITDISRTDTTATVTTAVDHGLITGAVVVISGANQSDYNGTFTITVTGATTFTYTVANSPTTPATGTIVYRNIPVFSTMHFDRNDELQIEIDSVGANMAGLKVGLVGFWV